MIEFPFGTEDAGGNVNYTIPVEPQISAYNDQEVGRLDRLHAVWGAACAAVLLQSQRYRRHWNGAITSMRDHKGTLTVTWRDTESRIMFEGVIMGAWEAYGDHMGEHVLMSATQLRSRNG